MQYRKLKGDKLFDGHRFVPDGVLVVLKDGTIKDIISSKEAGEDIEKVEGILVPGFINCHCHLELSHLKKVIPTGTGLVDFLISVVQKRGIEVEDKEAMIEAAANEMYENGIAGVGDICNTLDAINTKMKSKIRWHNLIEVINFFDLNLDKQLTAYNEVVAGHKGNQLTAVLTPHAPYTVSSATFKKINELTAGQIISIHNQETKSEDELFSSGTGGFLKMYGVFMDGKSPFSISGKSSLQTWLPYFTNGQTILLVHNTFIAEADILFAAQHADKYGLNIFYCLCPNANLYIENTLPPIDLLRKHDCKIVVGTDSYSSNWQLNIAAELKTIAQNFPHIPKEQILHWATANGAEAMGWSSDLGSFKMGAKPGVVSVSENDFKIKRIL